MIKYIPRVRGLFTFKSEISEVPEGSFDILDNLVIDREGILQPRRGYTTTTLAPGGDGDIVEDFYEFKGVQLLKYNSGLYSLSGTTLSQYTGDFTVPSGGVNNNSVLANRNFYIATDDGVLKLDDVSGTFRKAGAPKAISPTLALVDGNILTPGLSYRYRALWGYTDANDNLILGPVSDDVTIDNAGVSSHNVNISVIIPDEITDNSWFLQVYRSLSSSFPDDELQLMFEKAPTTEQLTARAISFNDDYTDNSLGAIIYTAPSQGVGTLSSNDRPPKCVDIELFQGHTVYANTTTSQKRSFSISATGTGDVDAGTVITINGLDYTGGVATAAVFTVTLQNDDVTEYEGDILSIPFKNGSTSVLEFTADGKAVDDVNNIEVDLSSAGIKENFEFILGSDTKTDYEDDTVTITSKATGEVSVFEFVADNGTVTTPGAIRVNLSSIDTASEFATQLSIEINRIDGLISTATSGIVDVSQETAGIVDDPLSSDTATTALTILTQGSNSLSLIVEQLFDVLQNVVQLTVVNNDPVTPGEIMITQLSAGIVDDPFASDSANIIVDVTQAGSNVEDIIHRVFEVFVTTSAGADNENTARSLIRVINGTNAQIVAGLSATYSASAKLPGTVQLDQKIISNTEFTIQADPAKNSTNVTVGDAFDPSITSAILSSNEENPNFLVISKPDQPEAVPAIQFLAVGSANNAIRRIKALRDSLFIFTDGGIYQMTGKSVDSFSIDELDLTARIIASRTVQNLNNQVWALCDQGIVSVTESEVKIRSRDIENLINSNFFSPAALEAYAFAIPYESDRKLIYFAPSISTADIAEEAYVYNTITNTWTRWDLSARSGTVFNDKINISGATDANIRVENKLNSFRDYADGGETVTIANLDNSGSNSLFTVADSDLFKVNGLVTIDGELGFYYISIVDNLTITLQGKIGDGITELQVYRPVPIKARWNPIDFGDVTMLKQFSQIIFDFRKPFVKDMTLEMVTDQSRNPQPQVVEGEVGFGLWGSVAWGQGPWGGGESAYTNKRILVPRDKSHGIVIQPQLSQAVGFSNFELTALSIDWRPISERSTR